MLKSPVLFDNMSYLTWLQGAAGGTSDGHQSHVSQLVHEKASAVTPPYFPCIAVIAVGPGEQGPYCDIDFVRAIGGAIGESAVQAA